jgi:anti-sigma-K factor RskA
MLLYAADALDDAERRELDQHLSGGCPACAGALAEAQSTVAHLPLALDPIAPPKATRDRLMQRVLADASSPGAFGSIAQPTAPRRGSGSWLALAVAAAILVFTVGMVLRSITGNYQRQLAAVERVTADLRDQLNLRDATVEQLRQVVLEKEQAARDLQAVADANQKAARDLQAVAEANQKAADVLRAKDLQLVALGKQEPQPTARGRIFWDRDRNEWHVQVFDMKPPAPGKTFELWFITPDQKKIPAGTFDVDPKGNGTHFVKVPADIGPIALAAVTDEPIGGVQQPTGSIQLAGAIQ